MLQIATAASGYCVLYKPLGWDTTKLFINRANGSVQQPSHAQGSDAKIS